MKLLRYILVSVSVFLISVGSLTAQVQIDSLSITPTTCSDGEDGTVTVYISGGTGPYNYNLNLGASTVQSSGYTDSTWFTFTGHKKSKFYIVIVEEGNPISGIASSNATIAGPAPVSITSYVSTDMSCNGVPNGTITVTASGEGDDNFLFELSGPDGPQSNPTGFFSGLHEGTTHQVTVRDGDGCPSTAVTPMLTIINPPPIAISGITVTDVACFGDNTGSIGITPGGGIPGGSGTGYTYQWTGPVGFTSTSEDISDLEAGNYFVSVFDANLCEANAGPITVSQATQLTASLTGTTDVTCNGGNDGSASMIPGGGAGGYTYSWHGQVSGLTYTVQNPSNMVADTYDLTLIDASGCSRIFNGFATISEPAPFAVTVDGTNNVTCPGGSDGSAVITATGGTGALSFSWSGAGTGYSSTDENPTNMPADEYTLTVTDVPGCSQVFNSLLTITEPAPISVTVNGTTEVSCFGGADGSASITASGGTPAYNFLWTGDATSHTSTAEDPADLIADTYDLSVTDSRGCFQTFDNLVIITEPDDITVVVDNVIPVNCNGMATGAIGITPDGGTLFLSFSWTGPNGFTASTEDITNLEAGNYSLRITDARGCYKDFTDLATVGTNPAITASFSLTHISCNGTPNGSIDASVSGGVPDYTYAWTGPSGYTASTEDISLLVPGSYRLTVTDDLGCVQVMPDQVLNEPPPITATATAVNIDCYGAGNGSVDLTAAGGVAPLDFGWTGPGGFTASTEDISGLEAGPYSVTITDANACAVLFTNIASVSEPAEIQVSSVKTDISCGGQADGSINITVTGGVSPYIFAWSGPGGFTSSSEDISNLAAGSYDLVITDGNGCVMSFPGVETIIEPPSITATYVSQVDILCYGGTAGSIEIDVTGGSAPLSFNWTNGLGATVSTSEDPTGLPAGSYSLAITDVNGCSASYPDLAILTNPAPITMSLAGTDITCYGDKDGTITVTAVGGTGTLEYSRVADLDIFYQPSNVFTGLGPKNYRIYTRDANRCVVSDTITIHEPLEIQVLGEDKSGQNLCYGDSSAQISIYDVTGGVKPYEYSINGGADFYPSSLFTHLPAGNYQTVVRDASGCEASGNLNVITQPSRLAIDTYSQEDITSCWYAPEGRIIIQGTGGFGVITYFLDETLENPPGDFQNVSGGPHTVTLQDANGCTRDTAVLILTPPALQVDNLVITDVTGCTGDATGAVSVSGSGGTGSVTYSLDGGAYQSGGTFTGILSGTHTVTLRDGNSCTLDTSFTVGEPAPLTIVSEIVIPITCSGAEDGTIEIVTTGGTSPLTYTLNPGAVSDPGGVFSMLAPGTYTVSVDDSEGCGPVTSAPLTLTDPPVFLLDSVIGTAVSCNGSGDGSISIFVSGGVPPYGYSVDDQASWGVDSAVSNLDGGSYEVYARDANLCVLYAGQVVLPEPPALTLSVITSDITSCSGDTVGGIQASGGGGTGLLEYSLDGLNFQDSGTFVNLSAGSYTVYLRDETGCTLTEPVAVNEPAPLSANVTKTDATYGSLGSITISGTSGGTSPYTYSIEGPGGTFTTEMVYTNLIAGSYDVIVQDANGCIFEQMVDILDVPPLTVTLNISNVSCFGADDGTLEFVPLDAEGDVEYSIDGGLTFVSEPLFENLPGNTTFTLFAMDAAGKVYTDTVTIIEPSEIILSWSVSPAECNAFSETGSISLAVSGGAGGYTFLWSDGSTDKDRVNIGAGVYYLQTSDANGCLKVDTLTVSSRIRVNAYAEKDTAICRGSSVQLFAAGGYTASWFPTDYLDDPNALNPIVSGLTEPMTYILTMTEDLSGYGCFNTDTVTISILPPVGLTASGDTFLLRGSSVQLSAGGGQFSEFRWDPSTWLDDYTLADPVATPLESIVYTVSATNEFGCEEADSVYIEVLENIRVYNVFTPNMDGYNDYFEIEAADRFPEMVVEVYSRWGDLLFSARGYDDGSRWDGTSRGKEVPMGTYYYVIIPYSGAKPITGNVTIIR